METMTNWSKIFTHPVAWLTAGGAAAAALVPTFLALVLEPTVGMELSGLDYAVATGLAGFYGSVAGIIAFGGQELEGWASSSHK